jgi:DNA-binding NarL/FixJ family response regulator
MKPIRVAIADDHAIVRDGIRALLATAGDIEVVGEAANGRDAIGIAIDLVPDIMLMDIAMPDLGGLEATLEIRRRSPAVKIVVVSQYADAEYVRRFLAAGVSGYMIKKSAGADLVAAIRAVSRGGLVLDPTIAREALSAPPDSSPLLSPDNSYEQLTPREKQVLKLVAEGRSNKEIAELLDISVKTAMTHREHLMVKLDAHNRTDLIRFALRNHVIRP